jgi:multidrug efflux pump subunit AcrA (membrane-fusion protein)
LAADQLAYVELPLDYRGESRSDSRPRVLLRASFAGQVHVWEGTIDRVEGEIDVRTRMLFAVARVVDPYGRTTVSGRPPLASGLFVGAEIVGKTATNVVVLPRKALHGKTQVLVVDDQDSLHIRPVDIWRADRQEVIVRSGLQAGELVCLSKLDTVQDGMKVRRAPVSGSEPESSSEARQEEDHE